MTELWATLTRSGTTGTIDLRRTYATEPADLWDALTDPDRLARWMAPVSGDLREGGNYVISFAEDDPDQRTWGSIEACDAPRRLAVTWNNTGDAAASRVVVTVTPSGSGAELHLVHSGLSQASDAGHAAGWQIHMGALEASIAGADADDSAWHQWRSLADAYQASVS